MNWPEDYLNEIVISDCLEAMADMPDGVIQTCITSPPYWGLRDYGTAEWEGGDEGCDHKKAMPSAEHEEARSRAKQKGYEGHGGWEGRAFRGDGKSTCPVCGAHRIDAQLGLEATPDEYVAKMVAVFREVRRVLKPDGTLWLNLGDSYAANTTSRGSNQSLAALADRYAPNKNPRNPNRQDDGSVIHGSKQIPPGLKPKDLVGIPWSVAFALRKDGWYLRQDIIWSKPNPMPESVTDRPTKAHEYLFLLAKSQKYYYDADAVREEAQYGFCPTTRGQFTGSIGGKHESRTVTRGDGTGGRNRRSVWEIVTQPFPEAHFATFPEKLIEPCILAGSRPGDIVMDPFGGSGTVAKRSKELRRLFVHIDLSYKEMAERRVAQQELFV